MSLALTLNDDWAPSNSQVVCLCGFRRVADTGNRDTLPGRIVFPKG